MTTIVTRSGKGSALTHAEGDANFTNLNTDKVEPDDVRTFTNKSIDLTSNTLTGTKAEFNTALSDDNFAFAGVLASNANGEGASLVGIEDTAGNFTATTVEGALAEIYSDFGSIATGLGASLVGLDLTNQTVEAGVSQQVAGITALRGITPVASRSVYLKYHTTAGDGGHGEFRGVTGAAPGTYVDNGGTIIVPTGGDGSSAWLRDYDGRLDIRAFGVFGTDDTTAFNNALAAVRDIIIPPGTTVAISSDVSIPRYTKISGGSIVGQATASSPPSSIYSSNGSGIILDSPQCQIENVIVESVGKPAGSIGIQIGDATSYSAHINLRNITVRGFETGILFENSFFTEISQASINNCQTGIKINPTPFVGDGGYVTTIRFKNVYVTTCDRHGIYDVSGIQSKQMSFRDVIVEQCGDATYPQVELASGQSFVWDGGYVESSAATKPHGIVAIRGTFRNMYINGANTGFDGGSGSCNVLLENVLFSGTTLSFNATGGANANIEFDSVQFDTAPTVTAGKVFYTNCIGTLPTNVTANSLTLGGTLPLLNIGPNASSNIRSIRYYTFTENTAVNANTSTVGALQFVATNAISNSVVIAFPTTQYPDGIQGHAYAVDTDRFRMKYTNSTGTNQTVTSSFICCIIRFA